MNIEQLRKYCLSFPHVTEDIKWGADLCFSVGGKMFCVTGMDADQRFSFKCTPEKFAELVEREGIIPAPYVARYHWVSIEDPKALDKKELHELIANSYKMVFDKLPARTRLSLGKTKEK
jgi:predicted DNA-binding protein (MmcQ/YjbR family)